MNTNEFPQELNTLLDKVGNISRPVSIFLYGSRAREDYLESSDYEVGILYEKKDLVVESVLHKEVQSPKHFRIYPYEKESFLRGDFDIPFVTSLFLRLIALKGKTLRGERVVEYMTPPPITVVDLLRESKFQLGRATDAIVSYRYQSSALGAEWFFKSCLWGTRDLVILLLKEFPASYPEIRSAAERLDLGEYAGIADAAYRARVEGHAEEKDLLRNIWYINKFVEKKILDFYKAKGDQILIE